MATVLEAAEVLEDDACQVGVIDSPGRAGRCRRGRNSLNVQRRDLTAAQKAMAAARAMPKFEAIHKHGGDRRKQVGKSSPLGRSREDAAKVFKVSDKSVQQAKALLAEAPDLAAQVDACAMPLAPAASPRPSAGLHPPRRRLLPGPTDAHR